MDDDEDEGPPRLPGGKFYMTPAGQERLRAELARVPARTPVVVVFPPVYVRAEPPPGSPRARAEAACRAQVRSVLATHPANAVVDWRDGRLVATPFPVQDSSMIRVLAEADALVLRAPHAPAAPAGSPCRIIRLSKTGFGRTD